MAATLAGMSLSTPSVVSMKSDLPKPQMLAQRLPLPWLAAAASSRCTGRVVLAKSAQSTPPGISGKVEESIKKAEETCSENAESGECVAAWDEVEELSAAASHAREKLKANSDPLENYCKDNPETDECRTYDN